MKPAPPYHLYGEYPKARRRLNHNMVELGVPAVPTLCNCAVIFFLSSSQLCFFSPRSGYSSVLKFYNAGCLPRKFELLYFELWFTLLSLSLTFWCSLLEAKGPIISM